MLTLVVEEGDSVLIGDDIRVHFNREVAQSAISVGVEAPREQRVLRSKLYVEHLIRETQDGCAETKAYVEQKKKEQAEIARKIAARRDRRKANKQKRRAATG